MKRERGNKNMCQPTIISILEALYLKRIKKKKKKTSVIVADVVFACKHSSTAVCKQFKMHQPHFHPKYHAQLLTFSFTQSTQLSLELLMLLLLFLSTWYNSIRIFSSFSFSEKCHLQNRSLHTHTQHNKKKLKN